MREQRPRKPAEIIDDTSRALDAGASLIHAHNSHIQLGGAEAARDYLAASVRYAVYRFAGHLPAVLAPRRCGEPCTDSW